jgi:hypothetical protein
MSITVKQLRESLNGLDDSLLVVLSKDAEGNDFSPLVEVEGPLTYIPDSGWSGEIIEDHDNDNCVVLWPTN